MAKRNLIAVVVLVLAFAMYACGGGRKLSSPAPIPSGPVSDQQAGGSDNTVGSLSDALKAIVDYENSQTAMQAARDAARKPSAVPNTLLGDEEWMKGPTMNNYEEDFDSHTLTAISDSSDIEDVGFLGFAVYRFDGHAADTDLSLAAEIEPAPGSSFYIYVVSWDGPPRWISFGPFFENPGPPDWPIEFAFDAVSPTGSIYVGIAVYAESEATTWSFTVDSTGGASSPPFADIQANPKSGDPPLNVSFDAGNSYDPDGGAITLFEWDFEGDGVYDESGASWTASHIYNAPGVYAATVRVTDDEGEKDTAHTIVRAGANPYYETEDNDDLPQANALPAFDFSGNTVSGSIGNDDPEGNYPGYDGDSSDAFSFAITEASTVSLTILYDWETCGLGFDVYDEMWNYYGGGNGDNGIAFAEVGLTNPGTYYVWLYSWWGYSDYIITGSRVSGVKPVADIVAEPSSGEAPLDVQLDAGASYDPDGGSIVKYEWDFEGDGIYDEDTGGTPITNHIYADDGFYLATVRVTDDEGAAATDSALVYVGTPFYEVEDNEEFYQATPLPAFPFPAPLVNGSVGSSLDYPGYDGDYYDVFSFATTEAGAVEFLLTYGTDYGTAYFDIYDGDWNYYGGSWDGDGDGYLVVYLDNPNTYYISVGMNTGEWTEYELEGAFYPGQLPVADIVAAPAYGDPPLDVDFDAAASYDPDGGAIVKYEWDFDGDGVWDEDTGGSPVASHQYTSEGVYVAAVRVTDDEGAPDIDTKVIVVGNPQYFEIEDNDWMDEANPLPDLPFPSPLVNGSIGWGSGYDGYDGDTEDFFSFETDESGSINLFIEFEQMTAPNTEAYVINSNEDWIAGDYDRDGDGDIELQAFLPDPGKYYIAVFNSGFEEFSDYEITAELIPGDPPVADFTADPIWGSPPLAVDFDASASYDPDGGPIVNYMWDYDGDGIYDEESPGDPTISHSYDDAGIYNATLKVIDEEGAYTSASIRIIVGPFYETEDNDDSTEADALPAFPFYSDTVTGNLGAGGYNGDNEDWFEFEITDPGEIYFYIEYNFNLANLQVEIFDSSLNQIYSSYMDGDYEEIDYWLDSPGTYYLRCFVNSGQTNYVMSGEFWSW